MRATQDTDSTKRPGQKIEKMEHTGVIHKAEGPTEWGKQGKPRGSYEFPDSNDQAEQRGDNSAAS